MKRLEGYKRLIGFVSGIGVGVAYGLGYIEKDAALMLEGVALAIIGVGHVDAWKRGQSIQKELVEAIRDALPNRQPPAGAIAALALSLAVLGLAPSPANARDCGFDESDLNATVFRAGFPVAVGFDFAVADFEVGAFRDGSFACLNASGNPIALACFIPGVGSGLRWAHLCPSQGLGSQPLAVSPPIMLPPTEPGPEPQSDVAVTVASAARSQADSPTPATPRRSVQEPAP